MIACCARGGAYTLLAVKYRGVCLLDIHNLIILDQMFTAQSIHKCSLVLCTCTRALTDGLTEGGTLSPEAVAATAVSASSGGAAAVAGPAANSCKVNDRLVLDTLEPVTQHLKGLVLQAFIRAKVRAYALLLGRYWRVSGGHTSGWKQQGLQRLACLLYLWLHRGCAHHL